MRLKLVSKGSVMAIAALLLFLPASARAGIIYNNFGAGDSYNPIFGHFVGFDGTDTYVQADQFTATNSGKLSSITVAMGIADSSPSATVTLELRADSGGLPGSLIESFSVPVTQSFGSDSPITVASAVTPNLAAGTKYWLVASNPNNFVGWNFNSTGDVGLVGTGIDGGALQTYTDTRDVFRLNTADVSTPEPASIALLSTGLLGLAGFRMRRRLSVKA